MKNFVPPTLLQSFLFNTPHHKIRRLQRIVPYTIKVSQNISDETYMDNFVYQVHCEYLESREFLLIRNKRMGMTNDSLIVQHAQNIQTLKNNSGNEQVVKKTEIQNKLIGSIKKLNENQNSIVNYLEAEELVASMNAEQASKHKKYLVYLYKWILNQKAKTRWDYENLGEQLKFQVVTKIYEGHEKAEERKIIQQELKKYERLAQARTSIAKGNPDQAKASYQIIFDDETNDANVRMEALEYLCKKSQQKGDQSYLLGMISKLKEENGEERHRKYVENVLRQLTNQAAREMSKNDSSQRKQQE